MRENEKNICYTTTTSKTDNLNSEELLKIASTLSKQIESLRHLHLFSFYNPIKELIKERQHKQEESMENDIDRFRTIDRFNGFQYRPSKTILIQKRKHKKKRINKKWLKRYGYIEKEVDYTFNSLPYTAIS